MKRLIIDAENGTVTLNGTRLTDSELIEIERYVLAKEMNDSINDHLDEMGSGSVSNMKTAYKAVDTFFESDRVANLWMQEADCYACELHEDGKNN